MHHRLHRSRQHLLAQATAIVLQELGESHREGFAEAYHIKLGVHLRTAVAQLSCKLFRRVFPCLWWERASQSNPEPRNGWLIRKPPNMMQDSLRRRVPGLTFLVLGIRFKQLHSNSLLPPLLVSLGVEYGSARCQGQGAVFSGAARYGCHGLRNRKRIC